MQDLFSHFVRFFFGSQNGPELGAGAKLVPRWHSLFVLPHQVFGLFECGVRVLVFGAAYQLRRACDYQQPKTAERLIQFRVGCGITMRCT
jgi:hypothetical protein